MCRHKAVFPFISDLYISVWKEKKNETLQLFKKLKADDRTATDTNIIFLIAGALKRYEESLIFKKIIIYKNVLLPSVMG